MSSSHLPLSIPSPVQYVQHRLYAEKSVEVCIKRDDLIHPQISGNKWRKLKYNIQEALDKNKGILTFGGAFSNHIHATAFAAAHYNLPAIGIIRGLQIDLNNPTLQAAKSAGMELKHLSREDYSKKEDSKFLEELAQNYPDSIIIPEGGNNALALKGVMELGNEIVTGEFVPDLITVSAGTATTAKGLLRSIPAKSKLLCFSSLKGDFLAQRLKSERNQNWELQTDFHFGGYAKMNTELVAFINSYKEETGIQLDPIYTAKMLFGLHSLLQNDELAAGSKILIIHTGGLQGIQGHNYRYAGKEGMQIRV